mmetsp:Transcript_15648/g.63028  ORF Transcript_15648/g.63028 Transcript_15648/m.63028 type:complete len:271 (+) Transcript_15648:1151-1963(+)
MIGSTEVGSVGEWAELAQRRCKNSNCSSMFEQYATNWRPRSLPSSTPERGSASGGPYGSPRRTMRRLNGELASLMPSRGFILRVCAASGQTVPSTSSVTARGHVSVGNVRIWRGHAKPYALFADASAPSASTSSSGDRASGQPDGHRPNILAASSSAENPLPPVVEEGAFFSDDDDLAASASHHAQKPATSWRRRRFTRKAPFLAQAGIEDAYLDSHVSGDGWRAPPSPASPSVQVELFVVASLRMTNSPGYTRSCPGSAWSASAGCDRA